MKEKILMILKRFDSKGTWIGIASIIVLIFSTAGVDINTITSWSLLGKTILDIISNPATIFAIVGAIFAFLNNPTDKENW